MIRSISRGIDKRLRLASFTRESLNKVFPDHWSFMLGEIAMYCLVILIATGVYLSLFFDASDTKVIYHGSYAPLHGDVVSKAYESAVDLSLRVKTGLLMRQMHHWAALLFIGAILIHLMRIFFTGAFRRPREINWIIGITMFILAVLNGFTGYSMLDDLVSGTGVRIAYSIIQSVPLIGNWLAWLIFGGQYPGTQIINRLFITHVLIVPGIIIALLTAHLSIVWRQKHTQFPGPGRKELNVVGSRMWPAYTAKSVGLLAIVFGVCALLGGLVQINPVWLYGPYDPSHANIPAQPDWYMGVIEGAMRLCPAWELRWLGHTVPVLFLPAVFMPLVTVVVAYSWPFLERRLTNDYADHELLDRPSTRPVRLSFGVAVFAFYLVLFVAGGDDVIAVTLRVSIVNVLYTLRVLLFVLPVVSGGLAYVCAKQWAQVQAEEWHYLDSQSIDAAPADPSDEEAQEAEPTRHSWRQGIRNLLGARA